MISIWRLIGEADHFSGTHALIITLQWLSLFDSRWNRILHISRRSFLAHQTVVNIGRQRAVRDAFCWHLKMRTNGGEERQARFAWQDEWTNWWIPIANLIDFNFFCLTIIRSNSYPDSKFYQRNRVASFKKVTKLTIFHASIIICFLPFFSKIWS